MQARYADTAKAQMRERILDAAYDLVVARGWTAARMADIAAAVGLSRQTLYNEFGSKDGLAREVVLRETRRFLDGITAVLDEHTEPEQAVEAAALFTIEGASDNPLLKAILTSTEEDGPHQDLLALLTTRSEPVLLTAQTVLAEHLHGEWPELDPADVADATEAAVRLVLSHLVLPTDPAEVVARRLGRILSRFLTPAGDPRPAQTGGSRPARNGAPAPNGAPASDGGTE